VFFLIFFGINKHVHTQAIFSSVHPGNNNIKKGVLFNVWDVHSTITPVSECTSFVFFRKEIKKKFYIIVVPFFRISKKNKRVILQTTIYIKQIFSPVLRKKKVFFKVERVTGRLKLHLMYAVSQGKSGKFSTGHNSGRIEAGRVEKSLLMKQATK